MLGEAHVLTDPACDERLAGSTQPFPASAAALLRPADTREVADAIRIAARHGVAVYPISRGRNWGYGDACPARDGQVAIDLGRMNRIRDYDETLGSVVLEPGVSQGQLMAFLQTQGDRHWMDCTGAGPETSLVGNALERGFGHGPYGNRVEQICALEVVLGDGEILRTGFGHFESSRNARAYPAGVGPSLDGLFAQSNLGVVTAMGLWLLPRPERFALAVLSVAKDDDIGAVVEALQRLKAAGSIRSVAHIGNDLRLLSGQATRDQLLGSGSGPVSKADRQRLRRAEGIAAWTLSAGLYGSAREVAAAKAAVRKALRGPGRRLLFLDRKRLALAKRLLSPFDGLASTQRLLQKLGAAEGILDLHCGRPSSRFLAGAYWRRPAAPSPEALDRANPAADACGFLWVAPVAPMTGTAVSDLLQLVEPHLARFGFDPLITFSAITDRALAAVVTIAFDPDDAAETLRAQDCHDSLIEAVIAAGYPPYRVGLSGMSLLGQNSAGYWPLVGRLKQAFDPAGILSPGRYDLSSKSDPIEPVDDEAEKTLPSARGGHSAA